MSSGKVARKHNAQKMPSKLSGLMSSSTAMVILPTPPWSLTASWRALRISSFEDFLTWRMTNFRIDERLVHYYPGHIFQPAIVLQIF